MYVNKVAYLTAISEHIRMTNYITIKGQEKNRVWDTIELIVKQYNQRGFQVKFILVDNELRPLKGWLTKTHIDIETYDAKAHVPTIKRTKHFLKERIRCIKCNMPFTKLPHCFLIEVVLCTTSLINSLPKRMMYIQHYHLEKLSQGRSFAFLNTRLGITYRRKQCPK